MLVLTRKADEAIILTKPNGEQIDIIVTEVNRNQVRIGVDADDKVEIMSSELLQN